MKAPIYSRFGNPTVMAVEDKMAELEGGVGAIMDSGRFDWMNGIKSKGTSLYVFRTEPRPMSQSDRNIPLP